MFKKTYHFVEEVYYLGRLSLRETRVVPDLAAALALKRGWQKAYEGLDVKLEFKITPIWDYAVEKQPKHGVMKPHWETEDYIYYRYDETVDDRVAWGGYREVWVTGTFENRIVHRDVSHLFPQVLG